MNTRKPTITITEENKKQRTDWIRNMIDTEKEQKKSLYSSRFKSGDFVVVEEEVIGILDCARWDDKEECWFVALLMSYSGGRELKNIDDFCFVLNIRKATIKEIDLWKKAFNANIFEVEL